MDAGTSRWKTTEEHLHNLTLSFLFDYKEDNRRYCFCQVLNLIFDDGGTNWCHVPPVWYIGKDTLPVYCSCQNLSSDSNHDYSFLARTPCRWGNNQINPNWEIFYKQLIWTLKKYQYHGRQKRLKIHKTQCYVRILIGSWSGRRNL